MALRFTIDPETNITRVESDAGERVDPTAIAALDAAIVAAHGTSAGLRILYDLRRVDTTGMIMADMESIARTDNELFRDAHGTRMAMVVSGALVFGQVRQYQILSELDRPWVVGIFHDVDQATAWLLSEDAADASSAVGPSH